MSRVTPSVRNTWLPGAEIREYDEPGIHVIETRLLRIRVRTEEQKVDFYDIVTDEAAAHG